jgi:hypothetical protein
VPHHAARSNQQSTPGACQLSIRAAWRKDEIGMARRIRSATKGEGTLWRKSMRVGEPANASTVCCCCCCCGSDSDLSGFSCSRVDVEGAGDAWGWGVGACCMLGELQVAVGLS